MPRQNRRSEGKWPQVERFAAVWSLPTLAQTVSVRYSARLSRSWGRTNLDRHTISLAPELKNNAELLDAVLCHELAHIAAYILVGHSERPHGPTWQRLVADAGHRSAARLADDTIAPSSRHAESRRYLHRCPICDFSRRARKPMPSWRCSDCVVSGLDGVLIIEENRP